MYDRRSVDDLVRNSNGFGGSGIQEAKIRMLKGRRDLFSLFASLGDHQQFVSEKPSRLQERDVSVAGGHLPTLQEILVELSLVPMLR